MSHPSKVKGNSFEREIVEFFQQLGFNAKRAWGSNGQSIGLPENVDVEVKVMPGGDRHYQLKRHKAFPEWLGVADNLSGVIIRADRDQAYILLPLTEYGNLLRDTALSITSDASL